MSEFQLTPAKKVTESGKQCQECHALFSPEQLRAENSLNAWGHPCGNLTSDDTAGQRCESFRTPVSWEGRS